MNGDVFALQRLLDEDRHRGGVSALGILARAEDVEEADGGRLKAALAVEEVEVVFAVELGDRIRALRLGQHAFELRHRRVVAVDRGGGSEDQLLHAGRGGGFEHVEQAVDVEVHAFAGLGHRLGHADQGGEVENVVDAFDRLRHGFAIGH